MESVLIIDDDKMLCDFMRRKIEKMGYAATCAFNLNDGVVLAGNEHFDVIYLDVALPDGNGLDAIPKLKAMSTEPEVIIMTGAGDPDGAELAIRSGAWDYIEKPSSLSVMMLPLVRALQYRQARATKELREAPLMREGIVGNSLPMKVCLDQLAQAARTDATVLITGETGTGKELFAWAIHHNSARVSKNFVIVDCAALTDTLVESILFGYQKGAYTGADRPNDGLIKQADQGTLFLDEVGELPLSAQKAFLRVLQERRFRPLGSKREVVSNFRLVSATNRNLDDMVEAGQFRKDLLFRLRALTIELPPLRKCPGDIAEISIHYIRKLCDRYGRTLCGLSPEFLAALAGYEWPGNVRELVFALERALAAAGDENTLFPHHLPTPIRIKLTQSALVQRNGKPQLTKQSREATEKFPKLHELREMSMSNLEKQYLTELLFLSKDSVRKACELSGLSRSRLYELLKKYDLSLR